MNSRFSLFIKYAINSEYFIVPGYGLYYCYVLTWKTEVFGSAFTGWPFKTQIRSHFSLFLQKSTFLVFNDQEFPILIQVYSNHSGCFNLTKIPLHRELFFRVSWRRGGSGGKAGGSWVRRGEG